MRQAPTADPRHNPRRLARGTCGGMQTRWVRFLAHGCALLFGAGQAQQPQCQASEAAGTRTARQSGGAVLTEMLRQPRPACHSSAATGAKGEQRRAGNEQRQPGRTQVRARKPQLRAQRRDRVRTWAQPSPVGSEWLALCGRSRDGPTRADRPPSHSGHSGQAGATAGFAKHRQHARTCWVSDLPLRGQRTSGLGSPCGC